MVGAARRVVHLFDIASDVTVGRFQFLFIGQGFQPYGLELQKLAFACISPKSKFDKLVQSSALAPPLGHGGATEMPG